MFHYRNGLAAFWCKLTRRDRSDADVPDEQSLHAAQLMQALHNREQVGKSTTLRQLHKVSQLSQPEALRAVAGLESEGVVVVKRHLGDAFESTVVLESSARLKLDKARKSGNE